jgi:hypothetical protein
MRIKELIAATGLVMASATVQADDDALLLECRGAEEFVFHVSIEPPETAKLILSTGSVSGQATISDNFYQLYFPQYSSYPNTQVIVNRLSGLFTFESGNADFGSESPNNTQRSGKCTRAKPEDKL